MNQPAKIWPEENGEHITELNQILKDKMGQEFDVKTYFGRELESLTKQQLLEIANCYKAVYNESWGESWTTESALEEVTDALSWHAQRTPIAAFLYKDNELVGFTWGILMDKTHLSAERDMPFDIPIKEKQKGLKVSRYWLDTVAGKKNCSFGVNWVY